MDNLKKLQDEAVNLANRIDAVRAIESTDPDKIAERDLELARDAALYLNNFNSSPAASALLAEVYYRRGQLEKASEFQLQAWMSADADEKADFKRALDLYKNAIASKAAAASK